MSKKLPKKTRASMAQNKLRSEGAEFLVLANLLIRDIQATNPPFPSPNMFLPLLL
jgi:hypothetical protein